MIVYFVGNLMIKILRIWNFNNNVFLLKIILFSKENKNIKQIILKEGYSQLHRDSHGSNDKNHAPINLVVLVFRIPISFVMQSRHRFITDVLDLLDWFSEILIIEFFTVMMILKVLNCKILHKIFHFLFQIYLIICSFSFLFFLVLTILKKY